MCIVARPGQLFPNSYLRIVTALSHFLAYFSHVADKTGATTLVECHGCINSEQNWQPMTNRRTVRPRRRIWPKCNGILIRDRLFSHQDLVAIRKLIRNNGSWGRTRLSEEVCSHLGWFQRNGRLKDRACRVALLRLEELGYLSLPPRLAENGGRPPRVPAQQAPGPRCNSRKRHSSPLRPWRFEVA